jgi:NADPH2:quinone reductase
MRAMVIDGYGGPEKLVVRELPIPAPKDGEVRIRVRAFGVNRAETHMREGNWPEISEVSGIECVGEVDLDPSKALSPGQTVAAIMGGLGRTRHGSYAEYTCAPVENVFRLDTTLPWPELAAIPESYATAWACLFGNLKLKKGQVLLVRGATSALGQAAVSLAREAGATVLASTRSEQSAPRLESLGAHKVLVDRGSLQEPVRELCSQGVDRVLELVGNSVLRDSLRLIKKGGHLCLAGFLGGLAPLEGFNPIMDIPSAVSLSVFGSFMFGRPGFPISDIPMQRIVEAVERGVYQAKPARVFPFEHLPAAHHLMESNQANGKIVVVI